MSQILQKAVLWYRSINCQVMDFSKRACSLHLTANVGVRTFFYFKGLTRLVYDVGTPLRKARILNFCSVGLPNRFVLVAVDESKR